MGLAASLGAMACTGDGRCTGPNCTPTADARAGSVWDVEHSFFIPAGALAEAQLDMHAGTSVQVEFAVDGAVVSWNVHSHNGDDVEYHLSGSDTTAAFDFVAPRDGCFFPTWINEQNVTVHITVKLKLTAGDDFIGWF